MTINNNAIASIENFIINISNKKHSIIINILHKSNIEAPM